MDIISLFHFVATVTLPRYYYLTSIILTLLNDDFSVESNDSDIGYIEKKASFKTSASKEHCISVISIYFII